MQKIRKGDNVFVMTGKDKGKEGEVLRVLRVKPKKTAKDKKAALYKVVVKGVNLVKKHEKPNPQAGKKGGVIQREAPLAISNVMLKNASTGKPERVGFKILEDGKKVRIFKRSGEIVDV